MARPAALLGAQHRRLLGGPSEPSLMVTLAPWEPGKGRGGQAALETVSRQVLCLSLHCARREEAKSGALGVGLLKSGTPFPRWYRVTFLVLLLPYRAGDGCSHTGPLGAVCTISRECVRISK